MERIFFDSASALIRTLVIGPVAYVALILLLRITGKRTLARLNAFDLVVTFALGSTLATILVDQNVTLAQGVLAIAVLVALQFVLTWTGVRVPGMRRFLTGDPQVLLRNGTVLREVMRRERVTEDELAAAVRSHGIASLDQAEEAVLETDGTISVR